MSASFSSDQLLSISAVASSISAVASAFSALMWLVSIKLTRQLANNTAKSTDSNNRAALLLDIADRWTKALPDLYNIRRWDYKPDPFGGAPGTDGIGISVTVDGKTKHYAKPVEFLASDDWRVARNICNFYESVGLLVYLDMLRIETLLVLVTVNRADHQHLLPTIQYLRRNYRPDIYQFWDYMVDKSGSATAMTPNDGSPKLI